MNSRPDIEGLVWEDQLIGSGVNGSRMTFFPTLQPVNMIFKGDKPFTYGHYGVHLGQEDRLVFLGPSENIITGYFIDCRESSPTCRNRITVKFAPDASRALKIPPGVAHTFDTQGVFSINRYGVFLPDPELLLSGDTDWTIEGDIVNVPMDLKDAELPLFRENQNRASELFYDLVRRVQLDTLANLKHQYPATEDITFGNGETKRIKFWKTLDESQKNPPWVPIPTIEGAGWASNLVVWTGTEVGYAPILYKRPLHLTELCLGSGMRRSFNIHCDRNDHLTFLGTTTTVITVRLIDCRKNSQTFKGEYTATFNPTALRQLIIPRGIAHRFEGAKTVFVVNCPELFTREDGFYLRDEVRTWAGLDEAFPEIRLNSVPAPPSLYEQLVGMQNNQIVSNPVLSS